MATKKRTPKPTAAEAQETANEGHRFRGDGSESDGEQEGHRFRGDGREDEDEGKDKDK